MKRVLPFVIAALLIPGVALAKPNPTKGTHTNHGKAKVQFILRGQLSAYTAFDSSTSTIAGILPLHLSVYMGCVKCRTARAAGRRIRWPMQSHGAVCAASCAAARR